ncbi:MAG TPA: type IVB secretion system lipoprotein DotD [Gammaproteobacteria bacterium]|jgi:defect-in-organelle-trafficking protein DotD|nr:type IVB secretion system lipoprotein DotD [Gammaproteobacteria bacterium]
MNLKHWLTAAICITLSACANPPAPRPTYLGKTETTLAEASYSVSRSLVDLAETEQAADPNLAVEPPPSPASYGMAGLTTIDWSGPVEPLIRQIANASNYRVRVLGTRPAIPVLVTVYAKNVMLGDVLRDVGYQCGKRANVVLFPGSRTIEIRYAKN